MLPLAACAAVFVAAFLFGAAPTEAARYGLYAAAAGLAYLVLVARPPDARTGAAIAVPVCLLLAAARWGLERDVGAAVWAAVLTTVWFFGMGYTRRRVARNDAAKLETTLRQRRRREPEGAR